MKSLSIASIIKATTNRKECKRWLYVLINRERGRYLLYFVYLPIAAVLVIACCYALVKWSELYDDYREYYQDVNRFVDYRSPACCSK